MENDVKSTNTVSGLEEKLSGLSPEVVEEILKNAVSAAEEASKKQEEEKKFTVTGEWKTEYKENKDTDVEVAIKIPEDSDKILINITKTSENAAEGQGLQLTKKEFEEMFKLCQNVYGQLFPDGEECNDEGCCYPESFRRWIDWCNRPDTLPNIRSIYFDNRHRLGDYVNDLFRRLGR